MHVFQNKLRLFKNSIIFALSIGKYTFIVLVVKLWANGLDGLQFESVFVGIMLLILFCWFIGFIAALWVEYK